MRSTDLTFEARCEERTQVNHRTVVHDATGDKVAVLVVNISPQGLMARCDDCFACGDGVIFNLPDVSPVTASVRWVLGGRMGCEFDRPIAPSVFEALLSRLAR